MLASLRTFLPMLVSFAALATQACAVPTGELASHDAPSPVAEEESGGEALALAGSFGEIAPSGSSATLAATGGARAGSSNPDVVAQLLVPSRKAVYDVLAYELGIEAGPVSVSSGGATASVPALRPLTVVVQPKTGAPSLANEVLAGGSLGEMTLLVRDASGKLGELAKLSGAAVKSAKTSSVAGSPTTEEYALAMTALTLRSGTASVTVDLAKATATCADPCPCGTQSDAKLGPFVQSSDPSWPLAKGSARVDQIDVAVSQAAKAQLDALSFAGSFETGGMCAVLDAAKGAFAPSLHLGVATTPSTSGAARESTSWDACLATVKSVSIASTWNGAYETVDLRAAGLVRTDRSFDAFGKETAKTAGWSFMANAPIVSCADVAVK